MSDILPTIRQRGVIQTPLVRPNSGPGLLEIVAERRRPHAAQIVAEDDRAAGDPRPEPLPCAILDKGDDAAAVEASSIEDLARDR